ncbi:MAG: exosortase H-associated membrane protein [Dokdonella sp.]
MQLSPIREFAIKAVLWLPAGFFLWFLLAELLVWPVIRMAALAMTSIWPELFAEITQSGHTMEVTTRVLVNQVAADGRSGVGELVLTQNPLIYGYSLPLFSGLAMAAPISVRRRLVQFAIAFVVIWLAQAFGVVAESVKILGFDSGSAGAAAVGKSGISPDAIALAYQFGYLILPAVVPVVLWIGLNREFIEELVHPVAEPSRTDAGQSRDTQE